MIMSVSLQFNCLTQNETAKKAMETYVDYLEKALKQYWNLWEDHIKLQEKHEQCNLRSSPQVVANELHANIKDEVTPQKQLNSRFIVQESGDIPLLELDSLRVDSLSFDSDIEIDPANLSISLCKDVDDNLPKSPIFSRTCLRTNIARKLLQSPKATSVRSNSTSAMKTHQHIEKIPSKCSQKLGISTTHHVETTFLPDGKRLKQSRLIFNSAKHDEKKRSSSNIDKLKLTGTIRKTEQSPIGDIPVEKIFAMEGNTTKADETFSEDVIEISPTQKDVKSKVRNRLKLKRKISKPIVKNSPNKNKYNSPNIERVIAIDDIDLTLCSSPKYTSTQMENINFSSMGSSIINTLEDKTNINYFSPARKYNEVNDKFRKPIETPKKNQSVKDKVQNIAQNINNFDQDETFYLPAEEVANKIDMDDFNLDDTENKSPVKKILLDKFNALRKVDVMEQLNMRCKADRAKLNGWDCWECEEYYKNLSLSKEELQKRKNQCSRHRHRYERPNTPEGFWDPEFPETFSCTFQQNTN